MAARIGKKPPESEWKLASGCPARPPADPRGATPGRMSHWHPAGRASPHGAGRIRSTRRGRSPPWRKRNDGAVRGDAWGADKSSVINRLCRQAEQPPHRKVGNAEVPERGACCILVWITGPPVLPCLQFRPMIRHPQRNGSTGLLRRINNPGLARNPLGLVVEPLARSGLADCSDLTPAVWQLTT